MTRKTLLIIGAGHEQVGAIIQAQQLGHRVVVTDRNPHAPGLKHADAYELVSTSDAAGNLAVAKRYAIDGVMTLGSETAVPVVAHIADALNLPGYSPFTALAATNKNVMRDQFSKFAVPTTESRRVRTVEEALAFVDRFGLPIVLKPSDNSGQRGTNCVTESVHLASALKDALQHASDDIAIIEKFYKGPEINVTAAVHRGQIKFLSLSERVTSKTHFGIAVEHVTPAPLDDEMRLAIMDASRRAIEAVGLTDGIAYPQVLATKDGPKVLEIAVRIPGGHMDLVARYCSGIDLIECAIRLAMGDEDPLGHCHIHETSPALSVRFLTACDFQNSDLTIAHISPLDDVLQMPGVKMARLTLTAGQKMPPLENSAGRFGSVLALGKTRDEARARSQNAAKNFPIVFETPQKPIMPINHSMDCTI